MSERTPVAQVTKTTATIVEGGHTGERVTIITLIDVADRADPVKLYDLLIDGEEPPVFIGDEDPIVLTGEFSQPLVCSLADRLWAIAETQCIAIQSAADTRPITYRAWERYEDLVPNTPFPTYAITA